MRPSERPVLLVVDDEPAILDALEDLLEDDFEVLKATSGSEGLKLLGSRSVSVVISDQKMPGMKGEEFLAAAAEGHVTTRILLTGYTDFDDLVRAVNRGHIYAFVSKPWSPHQLRGLVRAAAERYNLITERLESNRRLQEHTAQLQRMNQELSRFSFIVAHHLQEPLRAIRGFTDLLQRRSLLREGAEEYVGYISQGVNRAKSLMRDFSIYLDLHEASQSRSVSLADAARSSITSLCSERSRVPVTLSGEATIQGHGELITQLFRALLDNALVHGDDEQEVTVTITSSPEEARVVIEDRGPGIPLEAQSRVFHLFETLESGSRSGLGLALCQKIVELHEGEIGLQNRAEGGLRVIFNLRSVQSDPSPRAPKVPPVERDLRERLARTEAFASTAAHDLREPLRMVKSYLTLLQRRESEGLSRTGKEYLDSCLSSATRMSTLLEACLAYARSGKPDLGQKTFLAQIVRDVLADHRAAIDEAEATIEVGELPPLQLPTAEAYQVLSNLLVNALKYRHSQRPLQIEIAAENREKETLVTVGDNGIGVPAEVAVEIFEPFKRGDHDGIRGTGLGLATSRRIVKGWKGRLWCEPQSGGGTRFCFTVPS